MTWPPTSTVWPAAPESLPSSAILPSLTPTAPLNAGMPEPSTIRPFLISRSYAICAPPLPLCRCCYFLSRTIAQECRGPCQNLRAAAFRYIGVPAKVRLVAGAREKAVTSWVRPRPEFLLSSGDGQPSQVEIVHAGGVAAGDLGLFVVRHPGQDLRQDFPRLGKRRLAVRIVRAPHHVVPHPGVDTDDVSQANADGVLLEAQHDVAAEEVAREYAVPRLREGRPPAFARAGPPPSRGQALEPVD